MQWGGRGTRRGPQAIMLHECETHGLNFSFAINATSPLLVVPETSVLSWAPFTGRIDERRENYAEIMVLIMGRQVAAELSRWRLQMSSRREAGGCAAPDVRGPAPVPWHPCWSTRSCPPLHTAAAGSHVSSLNWDMFRLLEKSIFPLHFIRTPLLMQENKQRKF